MPRNAQTGKETAASNVVSNEPTADYGSLTRP